MGGLNSDDPQGQEFQCHCWSNPALAINARMKYAGWVVRGYLSRELTAAAEQLA